jgi:hypothetical protein
VNGDPEKERVSKQWGAVVRGQKHGSGALLLRTARRPLINVLDPIPHLKGAQTPPDSKFGSRLSDVIKHWHNMCRLVRRP